MKISLVLTLGKWKQEFYWGRDTAKWAIVELSGTVLTVGVSFSVKVG